MRRRILMGGKKINPYAGEYLTFKAITASKFSFYGCTVEDITNELQYSLNNGRTWVNLSNNTYTPLISAGGSILFKGNCVQATSYGFGQCGIGVFQGDGEWSIEGNIMSLVLGDNFKDAEDFSTTPINSGFTIFYMLFHSCSGLKNAENLYLPAKMTFGDNLCYCMMFDGCTNLVKPPELPSQTLAQNCYQSMFSGCTSLTTVPKLPATTLADDCYSNMFNGCTSLTTVPSNLLPATTLAYGCYTGMFYGCTSLTTAPELPATTLAQQCCIQMFYRCTSLNYIKCLATNITATSCTTYWVNGVASSGTFVKAASMSSWTTGASGIPSGWTVQDAS